MSGAMITDESALSFASELAVLANKYGLVDVEGDFSTQLPPGQIKQQQRYSFEWNTTNPKQIGLVTRVDLTVRVGDEDGDEDHEGAS